MKQALAEATALAAPNEEGREVSDSNTTELWRPETGNVCIVLLHRETLFLPCRSRIHAARVQPSPFVADDIFNRSRHDQTMGCATQSISLQDGPQTTHATQKCRWSEQEDQRLRASGENCGDPT